MEVAALLDGPSLRVPDLDQYIAGLRITSDGDRSAKGFGGGVVDAVLIAVDAG
jgi:hypothetical protein